MLHSKFSWERSILSYVCSSAWSIFFLYSTLWKQSHPWDSEHMGETVGRWKLRSHINKRSSERDTGERKSSLPKTNITREGWRSWEKKNTLKINSAAGREEPSRRKDRKHIEQEAREDGVKMKTNMRQNKTRAAPEDSKREKKSR